MSTQTLTQPQWDPIHVHPGFDINGEVTFVEVLDPDVDPNHILDPKDPVLVRVDWQIGGTLAPLWLAGMSANWLIRAYAESIGPGVEKIAATGTVAKGAFTNVGGTLRYTTTLSIGPFELPEDSAVDSGLYKLVVSVFIDSAVAGPFDMSGFYEGPIIQMESRN